VADSALVAPRDPKLKPYRAALWATYFIVILVPIALVVVSVVRHLRGPYRSSHAVAARPSPRVCVQELEALQREQNRRAWTLGEEIGRSDAVAHFLLWSQDFERRVGDLGERCHLDGGGASYRGRGELAKARDAVLELHRAYRAQANRFAQEDADLAVAAAAALARARDAARQP